MSKYTTGEVAKICNTTVRTVQYYDARSILVPSELSDGGRRLYSEDDLKRMKIICFLREIGLPINSIKGLLSEDDPASVITLLLAEHTKLLDSEITELRKKQEKLASIKNEIKGIDDFSVESVGDIAHIMENKKAMKRLQTVMILASIPMAIIQWGGIIAWIATGVWQWTIPYLIAMIPFAVWISVYYFKRVSYICPKCHAMFKPRLRQAFWAPHTPKTRRLTCPHCGHKGYCVETYNRD